jgi:NTE family protein
MGIGLALGGGGSKGSYEIGVWQAFRKLGLQFDAIVGTSIGSINAAFMVCDDYDSAVEMWSNLQIEQCLEFSENHVLKSSDLLSLKNANALAWELIANKGLNTQPLRELLGKYIREDCLRTSSVKYGLMTTLLPKLTPFPRWIHEIPENQLIDYMMASAGIPGLQMVKIDGQSFYDGGIVDNLPISMLRSIGIRNIIAVDLNANATLKSPLIDNIQLTYIHNKLDLGSMFDISQETLDRNRQLGYLDTMRTFGQVAGEYYSFQPDEYRKLIHRYGIDHVIGFEQAALAFDVDRCKLYEADEFLSLIKLRHLDVKQEYEKKRRLLHIDHKFSAIMNGKLKELKLLPSMRLAFMMEVYAGLKENGNILRIPMKYFLNLDQAATAMYLLGEETES